MRVPNSVRIGIVSVVISLFTIGCGGGGSESEAAATPPGRGVAAEAGGSVDACEVYARLRSSVPSGVEVLGSTEWYARMVQAADLYRQLQQAAPAGVADDIGLIADAQDVLLSDLGPIVESGTADPATITARIDAYNQDPDLAAPAQAFNDYATTLASTC